MASCVRVIQGVPGAPRRPRLQAHARQAGSCAAPELQEVSSRAVAGEVCLFPGPPRPALMGQAVVSFARLVPLQAGQG